jgi:hypothetical protein
MLPLAIYQMLRVRRWEWRAMLNKDCAAMLIWCSLGNFAWMLTFWIGCGSDMPCLSALRWHGSSKLYLNADLLLAAMFLNAGLVHFIGAQSKSPYESMHFLHCHFHRVVRSLVFVCHVYHFKNLFKMNKLERTNLAHPMSR